MMESMADRCGHNAEQSAACARTVVEEVQQDLRRGWDKDQETGALLRSPADAYDRLIYRLSHDNLDLTEAGISVVALGGFGRREVFPYSDLDLLILHDGRQEKFCEELVEALIYPLWDARISVGHAVRTCGETLDLAAEDLTACTSLLDARLVAGEAHLCEVLREEAQQRFFGERAGDFVDALIEERARRHRRFGETVYLLEPNIKSGKGGVRDLNTILWAANARLHVSDLSRLAEAGGATARQAAALMAAHEFLRRLRLAMHLHAGRSQDQLIFELQEALAPGLFPGEQVPGEAATVSAVEPAVERLMHAYYRHARAVVLETGGVLERLALRGARDLQQGALVGQPVTAQEDEHLVRSGRRIRTMDPKRFWQEPAEILRASWVSLQQGMPLDRPTRDALAEAAAGQAGQRLVADPGAAELFLTLLCDPERGGQRTLLEELHDLGVVSALIPEFESCTGCIQHDLYHLYTVDRHSIYVVARLKSWLRGEDADRYPTPVALMESLERRRSLFLAALLHDVAKPLGHEHAARGARLAVGVAARLGLNPEAQEEVRFLVKQHLTMAHVSQKRDLSDPAVISSFSGLVGAVARLRRLYLLTAADTDMTAPGNLTDWKAHLLDELYMKTYIQLTHGGGATRLRMQELDQQRGALEVTLRRRWEEAGAVVSNLPEAMLSAHSHEDLAHHLEAYLRLVSDPAAVLQLRTQRKGQTTQLTICCADSPGVLASITGVMLAHRVEVLAAQVYTLLQEAGAPFVLDIFSVRVPESSAPLWPAFSSDLKAALRGDLSVSELVQRFTLPSGLPPRVVPRVKTEVIVNNQVSKQFTVIEVQAPDRLGVLHAITHTLSELGLGIQLSKVATEAGRVVDIFYVSDRRTGGKVQGEAAEEELRQKVMEALRALAE